MALKDWKQEGDDSWRKKNDTIEIVANYDKNYNLKYYTIEIYLFETKNTASRWLKTRRFRTREMAIKQARAYMRNH